MDLTASIMALVALKVDSEVDQEVSEAPCTASEVRWVALETPLEEALEVDKEDSEAKWEDSADQEDLVAKWEALEEVWEALEELCSERILCLKQRKRLLSHTVPLNPSL